MAHRKSSKKKQIKNFRILMTAVSKIPRDCPMGKDELLAWISDIAGVRYQNIEDCSNGAAFCYVIEYMYPKSINLKRVRLDAIYESDIVNNYKIFQEGLYANKIKKNLDIPNIIKSKVNSTLELLQWLFNYWYTFSNNGVLPDTMEVPNPSPKRRTYRSPNKDQKPKPLSPVRKLSSQQHKSSTSSERRSSESHSESDKLEAIIDQQKDEIDKLREDFIDIKKERNFYLKRLRLIEKFCHENSDETSEQILQMLYREDQKNGFYSPE